MSFPHACVPKRRTLACRHVLSGNPDSAVWTPDKYIPEKRIRGKSGVTGVFEIGSNHGSHGNNTDDYGYDPKL